MDIYLQLHQITSNTDAKHDHELRALQIHWRNRLFEKINSVFKPLYKHQKLLGCLRRYREEIYINTRLCKHLALFPVTQPPLNSADCIFARNTNQIHRGGKAWHKNIVNYIRNKYMKFWISLFVKHLPFSYVRNITAE